MNKFIGILILLNASCYSLSYGSCVFDFPVETIQVKRSNKIWDSPVVIEETDSCNNSIEFKTNGDSKVEIKKANKSIRLDIEQDATIWVPKGKIIKKIVRVPWGPVSINGGEGNIEIYSGEGDVTVSPTVWGAADITTGRGNIDLYNVNHNNLEFDLYCAHDDSFEIDKNVNFESPLQHSYTLLLWSNFWGFGTVKTMDDLYKVKVIKAWAMSSKKKIYLHGSAFNQKGVEL